MIRRFKNKFDLAAKYPELSAKITNINMDDDHTHVVDFIERWNENKENIKIPVYTFYHRRSESVPDGRMVEFTDGDIIYHDGPLPYKSIPIHRIAPGEQEGRMYGYTNAFDLLPLQEALNKLYSTVLTNQATFGVQNIAVPKGSGINVMQMGGGLNIIEYDAKTGPPMPLQLTSTPAEIFTFIQQLKGDMETLIGVNSVSRGNPEENLKSGAALALVQSMAIQFAQGLQQSYTQLLEDLGTSVIEILQDYATVPRVALIAGKHNRSYMKEFKSEDIADISRVIVDMGNPLNRTVAGRVNLAEQLLQNQFIGSPQQFIEVLTSGRFEPIVEGEQAELMLIRAENEKLQEGISSPVIQTDNHELHIQEHKTVLASPESRADVKVVEASLGHISEHMQSITPQEIATTPQERDQRQLAKNEAGNVAEQMNSTNPVTQEAGEVNMPQQPINPLTGERFNPEGG
jgi:hypothetical protein